MDVIVKSLGIALLLAAGSLQAQQTGPIETRLEQRKVVRAADGQESFAPAAAVKPGDVIEYVATYRNTTRSPVRNLEATLPIPANTEFVAGSPAPATAKASVDSRTWGDIPLKRKAVRAGVQVEEPVPVREYRYLRWFPGELGGEKSVTFTARVRVIDETPGTPAKTARK
jgi:uncharacterized repeat protein (TIGR01451 family)